MWLKVLSKYNPTDAELSVLGKYLNFAITTKFNTILAKEIVIVTEVARSKLDGEAADLLRNEVGGILQNTKSPKSNLTKQERERH